MKEDKRLDKLGYYEMYVGDDFNLLTTDHIIDILNNRLYRDLPLDYLRVINAELTYSKNQHADYKKYGEIDESKIKIEFKSADNTQEKQYTIGKSDSLRLEYLEDDVYRDFYEDYVSRVNIYINNFYVYSNVYGDDPMMEFQTYLMYIHINVAWYLGDDEAVRFVKEFTRCTMLLLKRQGYTDAYLDVYMDIYRNYKNSPMVEEGRKLRNPKI